MKQRPTREELERMYVEEEMSLKEIAEKYDVVDVTVLNWMRKERIERRGAEFARSLKRESMPKREELSILYWDKKLSISEIGKIYRRDGTTILSWMRKYGIKRRNYSEAVIAHFGFNTPSREELQHLLTTKPISEIAKIFDVNVSTVRRWIDNNGIARKKGKRLENGLWKDLEFALEQGRIFLDQYMVYQELPGSKIIRREGNSSLARAIIVYHGGFPAFREKLRAYMGRPNSQEQSSLLEQYVGGEE